MVIWDVVVKNVDAVTALARGLGEDCRLGPTVLHRIGKSNGQERWPRPLASSCPWSFLQIHHRIRYSRWPWRFSIIGATAAAREHRRRANAPVLIRSANHDGLVGGQRDRGCGLSHSGGANQVLVLRPATAAAGEHQRHAPIFGKPAQDGDVAVGGQGHGHALACYSTGTNQLIALLRPNTTTAGEHPRRPGRPEP